MRKVFLIFQDFHSLKQKQKDANFDQVEKRISSDMTTIIKIQLKSINNRNRTKFKKKKIKNHYEKSHVAWMFFFFIYCGHGNI